MRRQRSPPTARRSSPCHSEGCQDLFRINILRSALLAPVDLVGLTRGSTLWMQPPPIPPRPHSGADKNLLSSAPPPRRGCIGVPTHGAARRPCTERCGDAGARKRGVAARRNTGDTTDKGPSRIFWASLPQLRPLAADQLQLMSSCLVC